MVESLFFSGGYGRLDDTYDLVSTKIIDGKSPGDKELLGKTYGGLNFDPSVVDATGKRVFYQRGHVWTLEQKQLLIHSIYNGIEIGKFIFKYNSWASIVDQIKRIGHGYDRDCIDGKQRYNALLEFVQNKFPDEFGNYYKDLSANAQHKFLEYNNLAVGELQETATDADIITTFLTLNFTGTPMSKEHIEYVQSIRL
jgi:hypothetical protein